MQNLIRNYTQSRELALERIDQLSVQRKSLESQGKTDIICELDLDRRIDLLKTECRQMQEIIIHLRSYARRLGEIVET